METSKHLFHLIVETTSDAIIATDSGGKIIFWNRAAGTLFGYSAEKMKNKHLTDLIAEGFRESHGEAVGRALSTGLSDLTSETIELSGCRQDRSEFPLELSLIPWKRDEKVFFTATIRDVTEQRRAEEEIKRRNEDLSTLNSVTAVVSQSLNLDEILNAGLDKVLELIHLDVGGIYLTDPLSSKLNLATYRGISKEFAHEMKSINVDEKTLETVMAEGKLLRFILSVEAVIKDRVELKRILSAMKKEGLSLASTIPVLLQAKEKILGVMTLASRTPRQFFKGELELLTSIGQQIAIAIENAWLYEEAQQEITERKQAEEALQESEEHYRELVEKAGIAIMIDDREGNINYFNNEFVKIFGYSPDEIKQLFNRSFVHPDDQEMVVGYHQARLQGKKAPTRYEFRGVRKDGTTVFLEVDVVCLMKGKSIIGTRSYFWDITERKRAEEALWESEEKYRSLVESTDDAVYRINQDMRYEFANGKYLSRLGLSLPELVGQKYGKLHPWDTNKEFEKKVDQVIKSGKPMTYEYLSHRDNKYFMRTLSPVTGKKPGEIGAITVSSKNITERKQAEEALRESEERLREVFDHSQDVLYKRNLATGQYEYISPAIAKITGYTPEEVIAMSPEHIESMIHPEDIERNNDLRRNLLETSQDQDIVSLAEYRVKCKDGSYRWISDHFTLHRDVDGRPLYSIASVRDITERKRADEMLKEGEEKYRTLFEQSPIGITTLDLKGVITSCNPAVYMEGGYTENELIGKHFSKIAPLRARDIPKFLKVFSSIMGGKVPDPFEVAYQRKDGATGWTEIHVALMKAGDKKLGVQVLQMDITERKRAEEALRASEGKYRSLVESTDDAVYLIDRNMRYQFANQKYLSRLGLSSAELLGQEYGRFHPSDISEEFIKKIDQVFRSGKPMVYEHLSHRDNKYFLRTLSPVIDEELGEIKATTVTSKDITERKEMEEMLKESEEMYRSLIERANDGIAIIQNDGIVKFVNDRVAKMIGYEVEELVGKQFQNFIPAESIQELTERHKQRMAGASIPSIYEIGLLKKSGEKIFVEINAGIIQQEGTAADLAFIRDITERKRAEEELKRSEKKYRNLVDLAPVGIVTLDLKGVITSCNKAFFSITGYAKEEIVNKHISKIPTARLRDIPKYVQLFNSILKGKTIDPFEFNWLNKDGSTCVGIVYADLMKSGRKTTGIQCMLVDITERKRAEERIKYQANLVESVSDAILSLDMDFNILSWNKAAENIYGWKADEVIGKNVKEIVPVKFPRDNNEEIINEFFEKGYWEGEGIQFRRDGTPINILSASTIIEDTTGKQVGMVTINRDITERKHAQKALWSSQEYAQNIVDSSLDMIIAVDNERIITAFNAAAAEIFGYESEEALGKHVNLLYADPEEGLKIHQKTVKHGRHIQETLNRRKNGELFPCLLSASVLFDADGNRVGVMGVSRDITERKQAEDKLSHYASELERSNRELQQFAHAISHDLQEPLRTMSSYVQLLADRYKEQLDEKADVYISHVVEGASRMREQIRGILTLSKVGSESKELERIDCEPVLESVLTGLQKTIEETHTQITHDPLPTVMADRTQIGQLFQNLIENAIKFKRDEPPCVHISAREEGDNWLFSVQDNGTGIDPEQTERIFEIFQRLVPPNEYPGTGIGLSICRKIAERHSGRIWVESVPGEGSTFFFTIPAIIDASEDDSED